MIRGPSYSKDNPGKRLNRGANVKMEVSILPLLRGEHVKPASSNVFARLLFNLLLPGESPCHLLFRGTALSQSLLPLLHSSRIHHRHPLLLPFYRYSLFATSIQMKGVNSFWNRKGWLFVQTLRKLIQVKVDSSSSFNSDDISKNGIFLDQHSLIESSDGGINR